MGNITKIDQKKKESCLSQNLRGCIELNLLYKKEPGSMFIAHIFSYFKKTPPTFFLIYEINKQIIVTDLLFIKVVMVKILVVNCCWTVRYRFDFEWLPSLYRLISNLFLNHLES